MIDRRLDELARLGDVTPPPEDASSAAARKRRVVGAIGATMRREAAAREARGRRTRILGALGVAAAIAIAAGAAWRLGSGAHPHAGVAPAASVARVASANGAVVLKHGGATQAIASGETPLAGGDEVATAPDAHARLVLVSGATVELVPDTQVRLEETPPKSERVALSAGEIAIHVPKLGAEESFRVDTPDAEVTVHGTSFVVTVREGQTHVRVSEGVVSVKSAGAETFLHPGEDWPSSPPKVDTAAPEPAPSAAPKASAAKRGPDPSTLAEQNRLLQRALDERRHGDDAHALQDLSELLARYPGSPLAQEARVERFRALERVGQHARAVSEARRYLADYPSGFAAEEARGLVLR